MNPSTAPSGGIPMGNLIAAEAPLKTEECQGYTGESDTSRLDLRKGSSSANMITGSNQATEDKDEITASPIQERTGRDIQFEDLPHPRKYDRQNNERIVL
jgi:hypothetical protein